MRNINFIQWGIALTTALFISGCSDDDDSTQSGNKQGVITTEAIIPEPLQWNTDNTIALYAKKADSEKTLFYTEDSQVNQATFEAVKKAFPTPQEGDYIRAFYPAGKAKDKANATSTLLPAPGTDPTDPQNLLIQKGNATTAHLSAFYYMYGVSTYEEGVIKPIDFQPQMSILTFKITLPEVLTPSTIEISTAGNEFIKSVNCNNYPVNATDFKLIANESTNKVTLNLKDFGALQKLEASALIVPVDLNGKQMTVSVTDINKEVYTATLEGITFEKGKQHTFEITVAKDEEPEPEPDDDYTQTGEGTAESPWIITTAEQLRAISRDSHEGDAITDFAGKYFKLDADISLDGENWEPIGSSTLPFAGILDGNNKTISSMKISIASTSKGVGFFAHTKAAKIMNLTITGTINATATDATQTGGLIGQAANNTIISGNIRSEVNITVKATVKGDIKTGGIIGELASSSSVEGCNLSYKGDIKVDNQGTQNAHTGGIIGGMVSNPAINGMADAICTIEKGSTISAESQTGTVWLGGFLGNSAPGLLAKLPAPTSQMLGILSAKTKNTNKDAIICYMVGWSKDAATTKGFNETYKNNANYNLAGSTVTSTNEKAYKNGEEVTTE